MSSSSAHPRRRVVVTTADSDQPSLPKIDSTSCAEASSSHASGLQKGATFHSPLSPSTEADPSIDVGRLPRRAPTSPQALEDLLASVNKRVDGLLKDFGELALDAREANGADGARDLPNPAFVLKHAASKLDDTAATKPAEEQQQHDPFSLEDKADKIEATAASSNSSHSHESDSGIGSSVSGNSAPSSPTLNARSTSCKSSSHALSTGAPAVDTRQAAKRQARRSSVYTPVSDQTSTAAPQHSLDEHAVATIKKFVLAPLLAQERLKDYHGIVKDVPGRIAAKQIVCLRDVEKTLILSAPVCINFSDAETSLAYNAFPRLQSRSKDPASYLTFCETLIQCVHTTTTHLNVRDARRPTDKAYSNTYFVDLVEQVRQYARIMEAYRLKRAEKAASSSSSSSATTATEKKEAKKDYRPYVAPLVAQAIVLTSPSGERIHIQGGTTTNGKMEPLRLVRERNGEMIPIEADEIVIDDMEDDDVERSMARKRKCDIGKEEIRACRECGKEFKRPCDLTKHEKTHSRPWKCSDESCKYYTLGWPTEKERDRHVNDKHSSMPLLYRCLYKPCAYTSKRESNCKQHMEKAHGWEYVRSKAKKGQSLVPTVAGADDDAAVTPDLVATPVSSMASMATPLSNISYSPSIMQKSMSPAESAATGSAFSDSTMYTHSLLGNYQSPYDDQTFDFNDFGNELHSASSREQSVGTPGAGFTFGSDASFTQNGFDPNVSLGDINWPPMQPDDFFPQWDPTIQQPTPSYSDCKDPDAPMLDFDMTLAGQREKPAIVLQTPDDDPQQLGYQPSGQDFPLFGEVAGPMGGESSQMGALSMFPELGTVGEQFGTDPMFDSMASGALDEYTNMNQTRE